MNKTKIEWCDLTINPVVGCSKCSPGCDNCYAEKMAARWAKHPNPKISGKYAGVVDESGKWTGKTSYFDLNVFAGLPKKPSRIFVGSMTDMFHPSVDDARGQGFRAMLEIVSNYHQHNFLLLTKRPGRMASDVEWLMAQDGDLPPNLWLGVTVCNQAEADEKIPVLLSTPAARRFVSIEPMLGAVDVRKWLYGSYECALSCGTRLPCDELPEKRCTTCGFVGPDDYETWGDGPCEECPKCHQDGGCGEIEEICPDCGTFMVWEHPDTPYLDWVICGGETGPNARPMHPDWVRSLRDQCLKARVPFFFKGWGEFSDSGNVTCSKDEFVDARKELIVNLDGSVTSGLCSYGKDAVIMSRVGKKRAGRQLDGVEWNQFPEAV